MASSRVSKDISIFDCDSHVVEPPAVWDEYVPQKQRAWIKTQFCFHTDTDLLHINGRAVPAARERSNAAEVGSAGPAGTRKRSARSRPARPSGRRNSAGCSAVAIPTRGSRTWTRSAPIR